MPLCIWDAMFDYDSSLFKHDIVRLIEQTTRYPLDNESHNLDCESMRVDVSTLM